MLKLGDMLTSKVLVENELYILKPPLLQLAEIRHSSLFVGFVLLMVVCISAIAEMNGVAQVTSVVDSSVKSEASKERQAPVSPYAKVNQQHVQDANEAHIRPLAIIVGLPGIPSGHGKRH